MESCLEAINNIVSAIVYVCLLLHRYHWKELFQLINSIKFKSWITIQKSFCFPIYISRSVNIQYVLLQRWKIIITDESRLSWIAFTSIAWLRLLFLVLNGVWRVDGVGVVALPHRARIEFLPRLHEGAVLCPETVGLWGVLSLVGHLSGLLAVLQRKALQLSLHTYVHSSLSTNNTTISESLTSIVPAQQRSCRRSKGWWSRTGRSPGQTACVRRCFPCSSASMVAGPDWSRPPASPCSRTNCRSTHSQWMYGAAWTYNNSQSPLQLNHI